MFSFVAASVLPASETTKFGQRGLVGNKEGKVLVQLKKLVTVSFYGVQLCRVPGNLDKVFTKLASFC